MGSKKCTFKLGLKAKSDHEENHSPHVSNSQPLMVSSQNPICTLNSPDLHVFFGHGEVLNRLSCGRLVCSGQIVMVGEVLNMFKNELSCIVTVEDLITYLPVCKDKEEDFIHTKMRAGTDKYI